ncbi:hypothetical protein DFH07DRAFT_866765 [Mycena maculata]|uniref:Uncharacterized protein n=1 Tax=Mycena maculata TaxID=230809 RepID=A0AAD7JPA5_9AGAR|nr:hypothetical protein DFH07DRAFT_866765 [Mycena maculata]
MPPKIPSSFTDPAVASSYFKFHPSGGEEYSPLRKAVVAEATAMGYDVPSMTEHGVAWADDQDPFGHVAGGTYGCLLFKANFRVFESFAKILGDKYDDLYRARGVGVVYPDCLLIAARISEVHPDRYFCVTSVWSYRQQAIVAESSGYVVFFDYRKGQVANLTEYGGVYADLHRDLTERARRSTALHTQWSLDHPKKAKL